MVDQIGDFACTHGERGHDLDPEHPNACLCGVPDYFDCPDAMGPGSIFGAMVTSEPDGSINIKAPS